MFNYQLADHMTIQPGRSRGEIEYLGSAVDVLSFVLMHIQR